jgi:hypothetical protein
MGKLGRTRGTGFTAQQVRDGLNLTTLIRWSGRMGGSFKIGMDEGNCWRVMVMRRGDLVSRKIPEALLVFDGSHADLSTIVNRAADAIKKTPDWQRWDATLDRTGKRTALPEGRMGERGGREYDFDIWTENRTGA